MSFSAIDKFCSQTELLPSPPTESALPSPTLTVPTTVAEPSAPPSSQPCRPNSARETTPTKSFVFWREILRDALPFKIILNLQIIVLQLLAIDIAVAEFNGSAQHSNLFGSTVDVLFRST